ncbi:ABC transporter ATP-binding protein [Aeoliella mucimassa]|uniref:Lipid A export ATP-binding/permease protein MsbA n=1 Tax=Aeoliella mucimassa TaxID=2527972 RepID=A0A518AWF2_9BACT|nr:ABC transporter ATP-binding protein [Aeoliella mucimassa]QDU59065.1 Lipid A export ATP-binding/permease protein MsbA [Aeoliella mucimassa]
MSSFRRVLKLALHHRVNVVACMITSLVVAVLWAGSLTAVFAVVDIVMQDLSIPEWIDNQVDDSQQAIVAADAEIAALSADPEGNRLAIQSAELNRTLNEQRAEKFTWLSPAAHRWLPATPYKTLVVVCAAVMASILVKSVFRVLNMVMVARLGNRVGFELRKLFYDHLLSLDMTAYSHQGRGDLMNRCTTDLDSMSRGVQTLFGLAIREPLKMMACFLGAAYINWRLLLLTILIAPPSFYLIRLLAKALKRANRRAMEELSSIYETLTETLAGMKLIKAFTTEDYERSRFDRSAHVYYRRQMRIATYNSLVSPVTETLGMGMILMAVLAGGYLVLGGHTHLFGIRISNYQLTNGAMSAFFAMLAGMSDPARRLSGVFNDLQQASAASDRVYQVLDTEPKTQDPAKPKTLPKLTQALRFENVTFGYNEDKIVLREVNLDVAAGETIAIVGTNGCGKSTLLQLVPRLYDPNEGCVTIDGMDIRDVRLRELRSRIGIVSQETLLFNDTVAANIAYGTTNVTQEEIEAAARKAHAHQFVTEKLANGYDTVVGPGGNRLSGGQRQRIALARAILRDPEILILDEATSQIDMESEHLIHQVLEEFTQNRTTLIITHRMSTISLADRVVVMDKGQVLDAGSHELLLARCDLYRRLFHLDYRESA